MVSVILDTDRMKRFENATDAGRFWDHEVAVAMKYAIPYTTTKDFMDHLFDD